MYDVSYPSVESYSIPAMLMRLPCILSLHGASRLR
jgi:hypothetical protein